MRTIFTMRRGKLKDIDRSFDLKFWQSQPPKARFDAVWKLNVHYMKVRDGMFVNSDFSDLLRISGDKSNNEGDCT